jgi:curli biogenesis system outer membrane secretion channel CsgG
VGERSTSLVNSNRFILLERKAIQDIQNEMMLSSSGALNPETAVKPGSLLGAQALIRGAVAEYSYRRSSTGTGAVFGKSVGLQHGTTEAMVAIDIRIYDTNTGQILDSVRADGEAKSSETSASVEIESTKVGTSAFNSTPLGAASREAIDKAVKFICDRMEKRPWEGAVAEVDIRQLTVNAKGSMFPNLTALPRNFTFETEVKLDVKRGRAGFTLILSS